MVVVLNNSGSTFAGRLRARPHLVSLAPPYGIADQHITIVALVGNERVVRDRVVNSASVERVLRPFTLYRCI